MKLKSSLTGYQYEAVLTTENAASSYGQPVLVDVTTGGAIDQFSFAFTEIVEADPAEREALAAAGYLTGGTADEAAD